MVFDHDIGARCSVCNNQIYIPFPCDDCGEVLCADHHGLHQCIVAMIQKVTVTDEKKPLVPRTELRKCSMKKCKKTERSTVIVECNECTKKFCLYHRDVFDHKCNK